jgi:hypothetical protein
LREAFGHSIHPIMLTEFQRTMRDVAI